MQFTDDMKIGVLSIDMQHKELIESVNRASSFNIENPDKEEMRDFFEFFGDYVVKHICDEEKLQIESKYPRYRQHKEIHQEFICIFQSLFAEFERNGPSAELMTALINKVLNWVITHIKGEDVVFGKHYMKVKVDQLKMLSR